MIISKTPYRVSFFGGGTDYPAWYRAHGGAVLATTINKYCYITCRYLPPFFEHRIRLVYSKTETCAHARELQHPAARSVLEFLRMDRGLEIHHDGDLPARSGIGSSSAFTVGLLHALHTLRGRIPGKKQLATESIHIEQDMLREAVGSQDQVMAAYGGFNHVRFCRDGQVHVSPLTLPAERLAELQAHLMLFFTGVRRTASGVASSYVNSFAGKESHLRRMGEMVEEGREILADRPIELFGELLHEAWCEKRSLSDKVTTRHIESVYERARSAGAVGGKILGAGGGGFLLLFVPPDRRQIVAAALDGLINVPFLFESKGSEIIYCGREEDYTEEDYARMVRPIAPFRELEEAAEVVAVGQAAPQ